MQLNSLKSLSIGLLWLFPANSLLAQPGNFRDSRSKVTVSVEVSQKQAKPGGDIVLAVVLDHEEHWHTHTNDPVVPEELGDPEDYIATELVFELPEDSPLSIHEGFTQWPKPVLVEVGFVGTPVDYAVFEEIAVIYVPITIDADAPIGTTSFIIKPIFQSCDDTSCLRPTPQPDSGSPWDTYGITVAIEIIETIVKCNCYYTNRKLFKVLSVACFKIYMLVFQHRLKKLGLMFFAIEFTINPDGLFGFLLLLVVAMGGGFLLNLTPCVLPVIPIKIMGLSAHAGNRRKTFFLGIWMMLGVMALWVGLGAAIALVSGFTAINQLFQYPAFTIVLGLFIGIMAIGMGGLFSIRLPNFVYAVNPKQDSWYGSFMFGIMTAVLSHSMHSSIYGSSCTLGC